MTPFRIPAPLTCLGLIGALFLAPATGHAQSAQSAPGVSVNHGWALATAAVGDPTAGYFTLTNTASTPDTLTKAACPIADHTIMRDATGKPIDHLVIAPGQTVIFGPEGPSLALSDTHFQLFRHAVVPCSLDFEQSGAIQLMLHVEPKDATAYTKPMGE
jgi:copper(I)-binding protein